MSSGISNLPADTVRAQLPTHTTISVVVPVFNSEATLRPLVQRLILVLGQRSASYEIVLVNDASHDESWSVVVALAEEHGPRVRGLNLMRNYGQHNALLCGIRAASGDIIVTLDDDLQNPPEEIPRLLELLESEVDVVYGTPARERHGLLRDLASQMTKLALQEAMGAATARQVSTFRVFRTRLRDAFADYHSPYANIDVLLTWGSTRFRATSVRHDARQEGVSNYTVRKLLTHALNMITGFSTAPLQLATVLGLSSSLLGLLLLIFVVCRYLIEGSQVPGFSFLASAIAIFSGLQMCILGIIGEYLARMHFRMMQRPAYVVRSTTACARGEIIPASADRLTP